MSDTQERGAPQARTHNLIVEELAEEALIYDADSQKAHCLNRTAYLVWRNCNGERSVSEIARALTKELQAEVSDELVWRALEELSRHDLLAGTLSPSRGMEASRRRMLRRAAITAVVAAPVIASLVAPRAAEAGSLLGSGAPCSSPSQCASGICNNGICA